MLWNSFTWHLHDLHYFLCGRSGTVAVDPQTRGGSHRPVEEPDTGETPLSGGQEVTPACEKAQVPWNALHWCERHTRMHMITQLNAKKTRSCIYNPTKESQDEEGNAETETKKTGKVSLFDLLFDVDVKDFATERDSTVCFTFCIANNITKAFAGATLNVI